MMGNNPTRFRICEECDIKFLNKQTQLEYSSEFDKRDRIMHGLNQTYKQQHIKKVKLEGALVKTQTEVLFLNNFWKFEAGEEKRERIHRDSISKLEDLNKTVEETLHENENLTSKYEQGQNIIREIEMKTSEMEETSEKMYYLNDSYGYLGSKRIEKLRIL